ncbi:unnamed protein product [Cylindrotheca closterium]|uniref:Glycosyltransferase 2-like domain-containing protein n=1 Tax=Cylindrotheca closterium TaxID=2856 RepID=A0AAD2FRJ5_9STRA|nr:unnamed protein product [Cylindrotheca closterium]
MAEPRASRLEGICVVNVGHYRSGSTTLAGAATLLGLNVYRKFPDLTQEQYQDILHDPEKAVTKYFSTPDAMDFLLGIIKEHDLVCDGWFALLAHAPHWLLKLEKEANQNGIHLKFVASVRDPSATIQSELQHWVRHGLEAKAGLSHEDREKLPLSLKIRTDKHLESIQKLKEQGKVTILPLEEADSIWPKELTKVSKLSEERWAEAFKTVGKKNANPPLPIEGILLTMRIGNTPQSDTMIRSVERLLDELEQDSLCRYMVVLAIDADEESSDGTQDLLQRLHSRANSHYQMHSFHSIINEDRDNTQLLPLCRIWENMAVKAWEEGADWVVLLGDDIRIQCSYHYRAIYRSFLEISERLKVPFGFGSPWWNDTTFPGFPTFPCIGKAHYAIFRGLIPPHRRGVFVNQDLDPYLQCLYLKFKAAPLVSEAKLSNDTGGNVGASQARYQRIEAIGWRDFVWEDIDPIRQHIHRIDGSADEALVLDVIVPSYRVRLEYLEPICSLTIPDYLCVQFIIIVDNVKKLLQVARLLSDTDRELSIHEAERILEARLSTGNNRVRVRCNRNNVGASASRNRGLDESAAEFFLNLDDDLIPNSDLLEHYGQQLLRSVSDPTVVGLIGLVHFPRHPELPLKYAAVLMSYLTFMFEIAGRTDMYDHPAWGVTANILFRRTPVRFDEAYAKTGGGEDVDFSLRVAGNEGKLIPVPRARVVHPFWEGSVWNLGSHFFNWAIGDGGLLSRFPKYTYWSFPNLSETLFAFIPMALLAGCPEKVIFWIPLFVLVDVIVDCSNRDEYMHRCSLLKHERHPLFYFLAHILANIYVVVLECGRLWGHLKRWNLTCVCHRFDWHCGRLPNAPCNFRKREKLKFTGFCIMMVLVELLVANNLSWSWKAFALRGSNETCPAF